jgi:hypothetical protein
MRPASKTTEKSLEDMTSDVPGLLLARWVTFNEPSLARHDDALLFSPSTFGPPIILSSLTGTIQCNTIQ